MAREILFRGKTEKGEWVEGFYCPCCFGYFPCRSAIIPKKDVDDGCWRPKEIIPETIGQYTGLTDKNGTKIFEGDIVCFHGELYSEIFSIVFADGCFRLGTKNGYSYTLHNLHSALEVIGNIHDNPELLKE